MQGFIPEQYGGVSHFVWGYKPSSLVFRKEYDVCSLEDGLIRSFAPGQTQPPLSLVVDRAGIYYDGFRPSDLERLIVRINRVVYSLFDKSTFEVSHKELSCSTTYGV